jgi:ubiquinone/menaquinone biosynthesis C-methylase UbiE
MNHAATNAETPAPNRQATMESVLRMHPGVQDVAVVDDQRDGLTAFVIPEDTYMKNVLGRAAAESSVLGKWRKIFDLSQLSKEATAASVGSNTAGWNSSYTRREIPLDEMREWVKNTTANILSLRPETVCEIGCGSGMLVLRIAPHCDRYLAVDFSAEALNRLRDQLLTLPELATRVELMERRADDLHGLEEKAFNIVLISSVVQFFPNLAYLTRVLESAASLVKQGGHIYLADVRSLPLFQAFALSVELFQAADDLPVGDLRGRIHRRMEREPELLLSPAFFFSLKERLPNISRVEIRPLRGRADNEMTRFRYDAILHVDGPSEVSFDDAFLDWTERKCTVDEIRSQLHQHPQRTLALKHIANARIAKDLAAMAMLADADAEIATGTWQRGLEPLRAPGIHPQDLLDLETEAGSGFAVFLSWAACRRDGSYDAIFIPKDLLQGTASPSIAWPMPEASACFNLAYAPGQIKLCNEILKQLEEHCSLNLPESTAVNMILVDRIPRAQDGTISVMAG